VWTQLNTNFLVIVWYKRTNPEEIRGHYLLIYSTRVDQVISVGKKKYHRNVYYQLTTGLILAPDSKSPSKIFALRRGSGGTVKVKRDFPRYLDVSPPWCQYFQFLSFLTGPPATNFGTYRFYYRILTLFRENLGISEILSWHEELCGNLLFHPAQWNELLISLCKICKLGVLRAFWNNLEPLTGSSGCVFDMFGQWWQGANMVQTWSKTGDWNVWRQQILFKVKL